MGFLNKVKTSQTGDIYCDWCGDYIKNDMNGGFIEQMGFGIVKRAVSLSTKHYCSAKCKNLAAQAAAEKKADYEERKANGQLTATEQIKEDMTAPIKEDFTEMGGMVKDTMAEPMNEMKNQLADQIKQSFAGISKGFGMFGKKK
ncbi:MAG: hypothetical protein ACI4MA_03520 [Treponema sp.]